MANKIEIIIDSLLNPTGFNAATGKAEGLSKTVGKLKKELLALGGVYIAQDVFRQAFDKYDVYERGLRNINTIVRTGDAELMKYGKNILDLQARLGGVTEDYLKGTYQAVSAGVDFSKSLSFIGISAKAAKAGLSETEVSVDTLTTILNSYGDETEKANLRADQLFTAIRLGKTTFTEIGASISQVTALAASSNIEFEQIAGMLATLTKQGVPTSIAVTQIRAAIIGMNKELGDGWANTMTLQEGMVEMSKRAGGSANALKDMMGRIEGVNAVLGATGKNVQMANSDLKEMENSVGALSQAFEEQTKSMGHDIDILKASFDKLMIESFEEIKTLVEGAVGSLGKMINVVSTLKEEWNQFSQTDLGKMILFIEKAKDLRGVGEGSLVEDMIKDGKYLNITFDGLIPKFETIELSAEEIRRNMRNAFDPSAAGLKDVNEDMTEFWESYNKGLRYVGNDGFVQIKKNADNVVKDIVSINDEWMKQADILDKAILQKLNPQKDKLSQLDAEVAKLRDKYEDMPGALEKINKYYDVMSGKTEELRKKMEEWEKKEKELKYEIEISGLDGFQLETKKIELEYEELKAKFGDDPIIIEYITKKRQATQRSIEDSMNEGLEFGIGFDDEMTKEMFEKEDELLQHKIELGIESLEFKNSSTLEEIRLDDLRVRSYVTGLGTMAQAMNAFYQMSGQKAGAMFVLYKAFAASETIASSILASMAALEPPPVGLGPIWGWTIAGPTAALGLIKSGQILGLQPGGSGGGSSISKPSIPSLPSASTTSTNNYSTTNQDNSRGGDIYINIYSTYGDPNELQKIAEREFLPAIRKAETRGNTKVTHKYYEVEA